MGLKLVKALKGQPCSKYLGFAEVLCVQSPESVDDYPSCRSTLYALRFALYEYRHIRRQ